MYYLILAIKAFTYNLEWKRCGWNSIDAGVFNPALLRS